MIDFERKEDDEGEPPTRSILGLGRIEPSPLRIAQSAWQANGEPPTRSLLGLEGLERSPLRLTAPASGLDLERPTRSILGLERISPAPIRRPVIPPGAEQEPPPAGILGLAGIRPMPSGSIPARRPGGEPESRSFFGLEGLPYLSPLAPASPRPVRRAEPPAIQVPDFERDVEHKAEPAFPVERAILASLAAHVLFFLLLLSAPISVAHDPRKGLLAAFVPPEKSDEEKIPIIFQEAPGPARANPKRPEAFSDADRRAGGGDRSKPRADSPLIAQRPGKQGLEPGPRRPPRAPAVPAPGAAARQAPAGERPAEPSAGEGKAPESSGPTQEALLVPKSSPNASGQTPGGQTAPALQGLNQAIRDAARGVGAQGEDGAGFPNPGGGFVDSGPLSFDTTWYDWGPYAAEMIRRIKLHWDVPNLARFGWKGKLTIRFYILADGRVEGATYLSHSDVPPFDFAAMQAILKSNPFRPLPRDLLAQVPGKDREGITVTFFYNIRPGESGD